MKRFTTLAASTALAALVAAPGAMAQTNDSSQLIASMKEDVQALDVQDVNLETLSDAQLVEIRDVLNGTESPREKRASIEEIANASADYQYPKSLADMPSGSNSLEQIVANDLADLEVKDVDVQMLTVSQLAQIKTVLEGDSSQQAKRAAVQKIANVDADYTYPKSLADFPEGSSSLEQIVANDLKDLQVEADVNALTVAQLTEIRDILNGDAPTSTKTQRVQAVIDE